MAKITIFGLAGTGTSSAGKKLAEALGYSFVSTGKFMREKAASLGMDLYAFGELCNTNPEYDYELDKMIKKYGEENDNFLIESWLAWHFVPQAYKVKFICDTDERLRRVANRDKILFEDAKMKTLSREAYNNKRWAEYYKIKDFAPDSHFDFIIDTTHISLDEVVQKVMEKLGK